MPYYCFQGGQMTGAVKTTRAAPSVSIITPVFNRQQLGVRAIRSILAQNVSDIEILIIDDSSEPAFTLPDDIAALPYVRLIRHEQNQGESGARNTGIAAARAEWIAFLDSDDYWLPDTFAPRFAMAEREFLEEENPLIAYVAGFLLDNTRLLRQEARIPRSSDKPLHFASGIWFSQGSTSILRKSAYAVVGPWDTDLRRLQDLDWFLRFALVGGQVKAWDEIVAVIEIGKKPDIATLEISAKRIRAKFSRGEYELDRTLLRRLYAYFDVERASIWIANRHLAKGLFYLLRSFWLVPRLRIFLERFWRIVKTMETKRENDRGLVEIRETIAFESLEDGKAKGRKA